MSKSLSVDEINSEFLPLIYDIIRSYERDSHELSGLGPKSVSMREPQQSTTDSNAKIQTLRDKFTQFRQEVQLINGIAVTKEEQLKSLDTLRQQLVMKRDLLIKYKNSCPFDPNHKI
ncbi:unnamed protein product [Medioppia subpectinata]|uniref:Mediator of RNA polymerase II transcription subunit 9 n=1 Tax=Medioppia subpectinata TaxID=1979941 RepID=A0A7R9L059_9ACAR|nr:unnamed protein product [Medioppia subpectinata]CAG2111864.1 unnamed protein product [Medioppia subpectinata]